jgi:Secretion system C-terminal sorting domain
MKKLTTLLIVASLFFTAKLFAQVDSVFWYLDSFDSAKVSTITDNIEASPLTVHGTLAIWDFASGSIAANKMRINKGFEFWAADGPEPGPQEENFVQFIVSPKPGSDFYVDSVAFWAAAYGTHLYMHVAAYWDTDTNSFSMTNEILYDSAITGTNPGLPDVRDEQNGPLHDTSFAIGKNISDGGYFVLRLFPWFNDSSPSQTKWLVLWNARVYGTSGPATDVEDESSSPRKFVLNQNYPNPFNPSTNISFDLEKSGYTNLTVYNVLGQKVATILSQEMSAGHHEVNFNASGLSSGVYLYRLESGNFTAMKKMMLMQ